MDYVIHGRKPEAVFRYFEEIAAIPHPSYHEEKIADYLVAFAKKHGLEYYRDRWNNVLIRKAATVGLEDRPVIAFQGHTDMVCEKNGDVEHDFLRDPLHLIVEGDFLRADGTTLGGDDGIAVALMLAILDGTVKEHPPIECLFTASEEVGLDGVKGFDVSQIHARRMVNLDSECFGEVVAGCAGGVRSDLTLDAKVENFSGSALFLEVTGLAGGHSGADIHLGRANANRVMGRLLSALFGKVDFRLISLNGGSKDNAIPRECRAVIATADPAAAEDFLIAEAAAVAGELIPDDHGFSFSVSDAEEAAFLFSEEDTVRAVTVLACSAIGVLKMSRSVPGSVEYSRNLGVVRSDDAKVDFIFSSRSAMENQLDATENELSLLARATGCKVKHYNRYPGWDYAKESPVRDAYLKAFKRVTGKEAHVATIHAGLECGILHDKLPDMDVISVGPTMQNIHSPSEKLDLSSVELFWKTVEEWIRCMCE